MVCLCGSTFICGAHPAIAEPGHWEGEEENIKPTPTSEVIFCSVGVVTVLSGYGVYTGM
jgi:hypothetical protein